MAALAINERWQREMAPFFADSRESSDPDFQQVEEVFHLD